MTGSDTGKLVGFGAALLLAGALLVVSAHRYGPQPALAAQPVHPAKPPRQGPHAPATPTSIFETWKRSRFDR